MKNLEIKKTIVGCKKFMTEQLCKEFHCTDRYVRYALSYQRNGKVCQAIRVRALELGASVTPLWAIPEMVTTHDETRGVMIQNFGDKTRIEFDKATGQVIVYNHGEPIIKATLVKEKELLLLQEKVPASLLSVGRNSIQLMAESDGLTSECIYFDVLYNPQRSVTSFVGICIPDTKQGLQTDHHDVPTISREQYEYLTIKMVAYGVSSLTRWDDLCPLSWIALVRQAVQAGRGADHHLGRG